MRNLLCDNHYGFWRGAAGNTSRQTRRLCDEGKLWFCVGAVSFFFASSSGCVGLGWADAGAKALLLRCWCGCWIRALLKWPESTELIDI